MQPDNAIVKEGSARRVALWLCFCLALVACMVLLGGYTRLSGSGLSITAWKPVHGIIPPLNAAQWAEEFAAYRATPQYAAINQGMTQEGFKSIYWPEYLHRLLGRSLGALFFLPLLWFAWRGQITRRFALRLIAIFCLGAAQGLVGWLMVKSGLDVGPYVNPIRLAAHLALAFTLFALLLWAALDVQPFPRLQLPKGLPLIFALLCIQILLGALLAGMHGGLIYNSFPLMDGKFLPPVVLYSYLARVQWLHRWLAAAVACAVIFWWWKARRHANGLLLNLIPMIVLLQFSLGIATLLTQASLPLALAHQFGALILFATLLTALHRSRTACAVKVSA